MTDRKTARERMQLRKDIGNRVIEPPAPPPYHRGAPCLWPSACFTCRKSWKRGKDAAGVCPECSGPLANMGRNFSAPKRTDKEQWKKVELLWLAGFRFSGSGRNDDVPALPETLSEVEQFLRDNPNHPCRIPQP